jgi:hypothetical protein
MAATPRRSLKQTLAGTVEERSPRFLLSSLVLAMVISLIAGLGIGIKIEQHRVKNKAKPVVAKHTPKTGKAKLLGKGPLYGRVIQRRPKLFLISALGRRMSIAFIPRTRIEVTAPAKPTDIVAGSRVMVAFKRTTGTATTGAPATTGTATKTTAAKTTPTAKEIVILTAKTGMGTLVGSVTANTMTLKLQGGKTVTISTGGAKIEKTTPGPKTNITKGRRVFVRSYLLPAPKRKRKTKRPVTRRRVALEIVVLPVGTAFG